MSADDMMSFLLLIPLLLAGRSKNNIKWDDSDSSNPQISALLICQRFHFYDINDSSDESEKPPKDPKSAADSLVGISYEKEPPVPHSSEGIGDPNGSAKALDTLLSHDPGSTTDEENKGEFRRCGEDQEDVMRGESTPDGGSFSEYNPLGLDLEDLFEGEFPIGGEPV
jgi:hypothetical protein